MVAVVAPKTRPMWMTLTVGLALLASAQPVEADIVDDAMECASSPTPPAPFVTCARGWVETHGLAPCGEGTAYHLVYLFPDPCVGECSGSNDCTGIGGCDDGATVILVNGKRLDGSTPCSDPDPDPDPEPSDLFCDDGEIGINYPPPSGFCRHVDDFVGVGTCSVGSAVPDGTSVHVLTLDYCIIFESGQDCVVAGRDLGDAYIDIREEDGDRAACV